MNINKTAPALAFALLATLVFNVRLADAGDCFNFWNINAPGDWFSPGNWFDGVPGSCQEVTIGIGGPVTLQFQSAGVIDRLNVGVDSDIFENADLHIHGGGSLTATGFCEINSFFEEALIDVNGSGSELEVTLKEGLFGELYAGTFAQGTLSVGNGGTVKSVHVIVGEDDGSDGKVFVNGGGTINTSGNLDVGGFDDFQANGGGNGAMTIEFGGIVNTDGHGNIGNEADGDGTVIVTNPSSAWNLDTDLRVGRSAVGSLTVSDEGAWIRGVEDRDVIPVASIAITIEIQRPVMARLAVGIVFDALMQRAAAAQDGDDAEL